MCSEKNKIIKKGGKRKEEMSIIMSMSMIIKVLEFQ